MRTLFLEDMIREKGEGGKRERFTSYDENFTIDTLETSLVFSPDSSIIENSAW